MLGFIFPVVIWGVFQALISLLLLAPLPIARVAIRLCKATQTPVGKTFMASVSVFLLVLLVPPVLEVRDLRRQASRQYQGKDFSELDNLHRRDAEALAYLSAVLTGFCLLMNFVLQKLGIVLSERELAKLKESTLLKQVKGLHAEYDRLSSQQKGTHGPGSTSELARLEAETVALRSSAQDAEAKLAEAEKKRKAAELNLDALKTQTKGLENEYDRLLTMNEKLERKLAQADPSYQRGSGGGGIGGKKDW